VAVRRRIPLTGNALYFVTTTVNNRVPIFLNHDVARAVIVQLAETTDYFGASIVGYVLMPTHLHGLLGFQEAQFLSKFMQSFKILSAKRVKPLISPDHYPQLFNADAFRLWNPRFDDFVVTSEEQFRIKLGYIHMNPVKADMVTLDIDYEYSSARDWCGKGNGPLRIDKNHEWIT
jgi:putative transposase